jgi:ABC-type nitrate/sulfonate/bicarbonate transport system permease component
MGREEVRMMRRVLSQSWGIALLLLAWQFYVMARHFNSIVIVTPLAVIEDIARNPSVYAEPTLWTLGFALAGLAGGLIIGLLLAILAWSSRLVSGVISPVALLLSSTPVVCLIPLIARIFGYRSGTELVTVLVLTFFPAFVFAVSGLRKLPPMSEELFAAFAAPPLKRLWLLALPAAMPSIAAALRVCAAYSVLVTMVAEYLMQTGGLGNMFALMSQEFQTERAFGASLLAMALSSTLYTIAGAVEMRIQARFL